MKDKKEMTLKKVLDVYDTSGNCVGVCTRKGAKILMDQGLGYVKSQHKFVINVKREEIDWIFFRLKDPVNNSL